MDDPDDIGRQVQWLRMHNTLKAILAVLVFIAGMLAVALF